MKSSQSNEIRYKTNYPSIFNVYWGDFDCTKNDNITQEIINNRNKFVEEYHITEISKAKSGYELMLKISFISPIELDHREVYKTIDNKIVCVFSNYVDTKNLNGLINLKKMKKTAEELGFKDVPPLYSITAVTFIAVFDNINSVRKAIKSY